MPLLDFTGEEPYSDHGLVYRPMLPVRVLNPRSGASYDVRALLDSGADTSMVSLSTLRRLGFDPAQLTVRQTIGTAGLVAAYEADVVLDVCGALFEARVVAPADEGYSYHLLGREPLFRHVHFAFEEYEDPRRNRVLWKLP